MHDREALRIGGIATLLGGIGAIVVNALHPRPPAGTDELLTLVADTPYWIGIHYGAVWATVLVVCGFALLVRTLHDPTARAIGEAGKYATALGASVFMVAIMVDGHGYPAPLPLWPLGPAIDGLWLTVLGGMMLRRSAAVR